MDCVVISLARRADRLATFAAAALAAGLRYSVQPAIDGAALARPPRWGSSMGAYGCALSHAGVLSAGDSDLLVFEDDAVVPPDLMVQLWGLGLKLPADWELLKLGGEHSRRPEPVVEGLVRCAGTLRTHAYLIAGHARAAYAQLAESAWANWDGRYAHADRHGHAYAPDPLLVPVSGAHSDIPDSPPPVCRG